jgi:uncharacterized membrane protein YbhN (UPF0104 family)
MGRVMDSNDEPATPVDDVIASAEGTPPAAMPSRRAAILRASIILVVLFVVFVLILPQYVDYREVAAAFAELTPAQFAVMTLIAIVGWLVYSQLFTVVIPGLSPLKATQAYLILAGIGASIPFGPWNLGIVWVVLRGWGIGAREATSGVALYGTLNTLGRFALPLIAGLVVVAGGGLAEPNRGVRTITLISAVIFVASVVVLLLVVRSRSAADRIGRLAGRIVYRVLEWLHRPERPDIDGAIHRFQSGVGELVHRRGLAGLIMTVVGHIPWVIALIVALRFTGVPEDVLPPIAVVAVYGLVFVITIIPIAPGGAGVPELLFIAGLSSIAGPSWEAAITAGVFLYRIYWWFIPIPLAWILLKVARKGRPVLPTATEMRSYTVSGA